MKQIRSNRADMLQHIRKACFPRSRLSPSSIKVLGVVALFVVSAGLAGATTVTQYRARIHDAATTLNNLAAENRNGADSASAAQWVASFAQVRSLLPATETIDSGAGPSPVNNKWLHEALSDCEKAASGAPRTEMLRRIIERLEALHVRLAETDNAGATNAQGKGENKARLAEILKRSEYQKKQAESSAIARLWQRFLRWLASLFPDAAPSESSSGANLISTVAQIFVVGLALAVIAYAVSKLVPRFLDNRRPRKRGKREPRIVLGETLEPDQTAGDLLAQAELLARSGDLRAAIRKAYIALLCELGDRKIIRLAQHKTNRDYLRAVREMAPLHEEMGKLTRSFESHWYGFIPATESEWSSFRHGYQRAVSDDTLSNK